MEEQLPVVRLSESLVTKLESISQDIKVYINIGVMNPHLHNIPGLTCVPSEDMEELMEIRRRIKVLSRKLRYKLK
jgi:hypothetical protein